MNLFDQNKDWKKAHEMAAHLPRINDKKTKRQQKVLICRQWIKALNGASRG